MHPEPNPIFDPSPATAPRRQIEWGTWIAWVVIVASTVWIIRLNWPAASGAEPLLKAADPAAVPSVQLELASRSALGAKSILPKDGPTTLPSTSPDAALIKQLRETAKTPTDQLRLVPLIAEFEGAGAAVTQLDSIEKQSGPQAPTARTSLDRDIKGFREIYTQGPDKLAAGDRERLLARHGWFARVALSYGAAQDDPGRRAVIRSATRAFGVNIAVALAGLVGLVAGIALIITAIVFGSKGRLRRAYPYAGLPPGGPYAAVPRMHQYLPPPGWYPAPAYVPMGSTLGAPWQPPPPWNQPALYSAPVYSFVPYAPAGFGPPLPWDSPPPASPSPVIEPIIPAAPVRSGPFLEAFALFLGGRLALGYLIHWLVSEPSPAWEWAILVLPAAFFWPLLRGITWPELRRGLGWHAGRGVFREMGAGVVVYIAGLPLLGLATLISLFITKVTHFRAEHPIQYEAGHGLWSNVSIYLLACVYAPMVEETFFRGALFHHLRQRWGWIISAGVTSFLFAAIHPQGPAGVPVLAAIAITFAVMREWRGSLVPSVTAHALNNFVMVTVLLLVLESG